ncbi:MAG: hypothetical protein IJ706_01350 [Clostridia bacterium]|nr:hypothetical protein [Clostridia bacterium]
MTKEVNPTLMRIASLVSLASSPSKRFIGGGLARFFSFQGRHVSGAIHRYCPHRKTAMTTEVYSALAVRASLVLLVSSPSKEGA